MKLVRKGHGHAHRGVIGVESAIVMIAFVIVAAALAFVVLNMGFSTTQKAKTTIISGLSEASSSIEISGKVTGIGCTATANGCSTPYLNATAIPIKVASGGDSINLATSSASVKYLSNTVEYDNIYECALTDGEKGNLTEAFDDAVTDATCTTFTGSVNPVNGDVPASTRAILYFTESTGTMNAILDQGEHAILAIAYSSADRPTSLDTIRAEILLATGAALTAERNVPTITNLVVDLG